MSYNLLQANYRVMLHVLAVLGNASLVQKICFQKCAKAIEKNCKMEISLHCVVLLPSGTGMNTRGQA